MVWLYKGTKTSTNYLLFLLAVENIVLISMGHMLIYQLTLLKFHISNCISTYIAQGHWAALNQAFFKSKQNNLL